MQMTHILIYSCEKYFVHKALMRLKINNIDNIQGIK